MGMGTICVESGMPKKYRPVVQKIPIARARSRFPIVRERRTNLERLVREGMYTPHR